MLFCVIRGSACAEIGWFLLVGVSEFAGGYSFVGFEGFDEIADVGKAAGEGNVGYAGP